jgi:regulator of sirC expression with transglutaminase-like and TPR domain
VAQARFAALVARPDDEIPLDEAALLIAAHARPELDVAAELGRLDELAAGCKEPTVDGVAHHLFDELGFRGNTEQYQDPDNSYLDQVLRRRLGIPITLSVLTMEVGRRLGVLFDGVGMPGHFLIRHRAEPATFLDPFGGGRRLDVAGCRAIFNSLGGTGPGDRGRPPDSGGVSRLGPGDRGRPPDSGGVSRLGPGDRGRPPDSGGVSRLGPGDRGRPPDSGGVSRLGWQESYLDPVGPRTILTRMLLNLQGIFLPSDLRSAAWVLELRLTIPGLPVADRLGLARALGSLGRFASAATELDRVAAELPAEEAATVAAEAKGLRARAN